MIIFFLSNNLSTTLTNTPFILLFNLVISCILSTNSFFTNASVTANKFADHARKCTIYKVHSDAFTKRDTLYKICYRQHHDFFNSTKGS